MSVAVYLSRCRGRVSDVLDLEALSARIAGEAGLVRVVDDLFDPDVIAGMVDDVGSKGIDAVVLCGNSIAHYRRSLSGNHVRQALVAAGVNGNRVVAANLLEQVALPHAADPAGAAAKALALVQVAIAGASAAPMIEGEWQSPLRSVLILGTTTEGLVAAGRLLQLGYEVIIADHGDALARARRSILPATGSYVMGHPSASFVSEAHVTDGTGWLGDFEITLSSPEVSEAVKVGGILLAEPHESSWVSALRGHFRIDLDDMGCARSLDPATHPAETVEPGLMVVPVREGALTRRAKVQAGDAAALALVLALTQDSVEHVLDVSHVDETVCGGCASCVKTCAFAACFIGEDGLSHVDPRRCRGCGKCVVGCPVGARDVLNSPHDSLMGAIQTLARSEVAGPKVIGFLCGGCGYPAADKAGEDCAVGSAGYPAGFLPVRVPCGGRLDTLYVLHAFRAGFDGVAVFRCREGHCHNVIGNLDMDRRVNLLRTVLRSRGIDDARLRISDVSPDEGIGFLDTVNAMFDTLREPSAMGGAA